MFSISFYSASLLWQPTLILTVTNLNINFNTNLFYDMH